MIRRVWILALGLLTFSVVAPDVASAQGRRGPDVDRAQLERQIRARFAGIIRERLGLDQDQADRLGEVLGSFEAPRRQLRRDEAALRHEVDDFLGRASQDQQQARALMDRMASLRVREADLFAREQEGLLQVLTPAQLLRFHTVRDELNQRVRRLRSGGDERRRRPGGSNGPGSWSPPNR